MEKPISQGNAALPLSGISSADGGPEAGGLRGAVANNHGNDKRCKPAPRQRLGSASCLRYCWWSVPAWPTFTSSRESNMQHIHQQPHLTIRPSDDRTRLLARTQHYRAIRLEAPGVPEPQRQRLQADLAHHYSGCGRGCGRHWRRIWAGGCGSGHRLPVGGRRVFQPDGQPVAAGRRDLRGSGGLRGRRKVGRAAAR